MREPRQPRLVHFTTFSTLLVLDLQAGIGRNVTTIFVVAAQHYRTKVLMCKVLLWMHVIPQQRRVLASVPKHVCYAVRDETSAFNGRIKMRYGSAATTKHGLRR